MKRLAAPALGPSAPLDLANGSRSGKIAMRSLLGHSVWPFVPALAALGLSVATPASAATDITGPAGSSASFSNYQPSLAVNMLVQNSGAYPCSDCGYGAGSTLGFVRSFSFNFDFGTVAPQAQGQLLDIASNTALFSLLGTYYGGDGETTFALPDLTGRTPIGWGSAPGLDTFDIGGVYGNADTVLTLENLPAHAHRLPGGDLTDTAGGGQPFDNHQPSLGLTYAIQVDGVFPGLGGGLTQGFLGQVGLFAGNFEPGWMIADGRLLPISEYGALFQIIGTIYGGDGLTTFAIPDLRGRTIIGASQDPVLGLIHLGDARGMSDTALAASQMPKHDHDLAGGDTTDAAGLGQPFGQHQPSLALNYLVALQGLYPDSEGGLSSDNFMLGEIIPFAGTFAPGGFAFAHGQILPINQNQALFSLFGTQFGGNGQTSFALPDLRGRVLVGSGPGFDIATQLGLHFTTLSEANLATHTHTYGVDGGGVDGGVPEPATWAMLLLGFGLVGGTLRSARRKAAFDPT